MFTRHKFEIRIQDGPTEIEIGCEAGQEEFRVGCMHSLGPINVWANVHTNDPAKVTYRFRVFGTGHEIRDPDHLIFVDTVISGGHVWHVYYERNGTNNRAVMD